MLRPFVLLLLLSNLAYLAWSSGVLRAYGFAPDSQAEPQRLAQQIRPDALRILSASELKQVQDQAQDQAQAEQSPSECLSAGPLEEAQLAAVRSALETALPAGSWTVDAMDVAARWIIYMGPYPNADMLAKKRGELEALKLPMETPDNPALQPGISLGGFDSKPAADAALQQLSGRGIHTARVVQERVPGKAYQLRLPALTPAWKARLPDLHSQLGSHPLKSCS